MLALGVNGADLSLDYGFPARVMVVNGPGVHYAKWVRPVDGRPREWTRSRVAHRRSGRRTFATRQATVVRREPRRGSPSAAARPASPSRQADADGDPRPGPHASRREAPNHPRHKCYVANWWMTGYDCPGQVDTTGWSHLGVGIRGCKGLEGQKVEVAG
ncbi:molybdopterin-dependent oxidoreductase [Actinopolymorpha sp. NPDC004070]|uniref:molybdopterin-dependent oxidoreductase n=1 Tax=Actinopolymorpha sp. NPDC004070 TaxID=3154548 RepID=UPI0033AAA660